MANRSKNKKKKRKKMLGFGINGPVRGRHGKYKSPTLVHRITLGNRYNKSQLIVLLAILVVAGYFIYHSFAASTSATVTGQDFMGISTGGGLQWDTQSNIRARLDNMQKAGAKWLRFDIDWNAIQAAGPNSYNWAAHDFVVQQAAARGIKILGTIDYTPPWARPAGVTASDNPGMYYPPSNVSYYANFAKAAAAHYAPMGVHYWEIWNEPNNYIFWKPGPDAAAYVKLLKAAYTAIKQTDSSAIVVSGGLSPHGTYDSNDPGWVNPLKYLQQMYADGVHGYFDALGWHPYCGVHAVTAVSDYCTWTNMYTYSTPSLSARAQMTANGDGNKKIWMTEFGYCVNGYSYCSVSESTQANFLAIAYSAIKNYSWAGPLFWFQDKDQGDSKYGLTRADGSYRPAFLTYAQAAQNFGKPDTTAPTTVTWAVPTSTNLTVSGTQTFAINAVDNAGGSGIDHVDLFINGTLLGHTTPYLGYDYTWDTIATHVANGTYSIVAKAYDKAGNVASSPTLTVTVSNFGIESTSKATIVAPSDLTKTYSGTDVILAANASDPSGIQYVDYYANGSFIGHAVSAYGWDLHWNSTTFPDGTVSIVAQAGTNDGKVLHSPAIQLKIANNGSRPAVYWLQPNQFSQTLKWPTTLAVGADSPYGISKIEFYNASNNRLIGTTTTPVLGYDLGIPTYGVGIYQMYAKAYDGRGISNTSATIGFGITP